MPTNCERHGKHRHVEVRWVAEIDRPIRNERLDFGSGETLRSYLGFDEVRERQLKNLEIVGAGGLAGGIRGGDIEHVLGVWPKGNAQPELRLTCWQLLANSRRSTCDSHGGLANSVSEGTVDDLRRLKRWGNWGLDRQSQLPTPDCETIVERNYFGTRRKRYGARPYGSRWIDVQKRRRTRRRVRRQRRYRDPRTEVGCGRPLQEVRELAGDCYRQALLPLLARVRIHLRQHGRPRCHREPVGEGRYFRARRQSYRACAGDGSRID